MTDKKEVLPPGNQASALPGAVADGEDLLHGGKVMSLWDHLGELRGRIVRSIIVVMGLFVVFLLGASELLIVLKQPLVDALPKGVPALHFTGPMDVVFVNMKIAFLAAVIVGCPVWIWQFWKFFEPALYPRERRYILPFIAASILLFFSGIAFCYYVMLPVTLSFLMTMGMEAATPIITITDYVSLLTLLIFGFGFVFETPLVLVLLGMLEILTSEVLSEYRRIIVFILVVIAMLLTPPDPISWAIMFGPMYLMFEGSIVLIRRIEKGRTKTASKAQQSDIKTPT